MPAYDFLIVGSGLYGAVFAHEMKEKGYRCLVIDKRPVVGGNIRCEQVEGITVHQYGPHIFHTNSFAVWEYVNRFVHFLPYTFQPVANYKDRLFSLPFNLNTFYQLWGLWHPDDVQWKIDQQRFGGIPVNLEEQALSLVGKDVYEILIKGYTEKQWGRACADLPPSIIKRLPVRFTYDNNYFNDRYQGIPLGGYNELTAGLLAGIECKTGVDYFSDKGYFDSLAERVVFTGPIDQYFGYRLGALEYRSLRFKHRVHRVENFQGCAVMNFTAKDVPYTRSIEHKHFDQKLPACKQTVVTQEYPQAWQKGREPFYPVNDWKNKKLLQQYRELAAREPGVRFGGRLGSYQYYDMDQVVAQALADAATLKPL